MVIVDFLLGAGTAPGQDHNDAALTKWSMIMQLPSPKPTTTLEYSRPTIAARPFLCRTNNLHFESIP